MAREAKDSKRVNIFMSKTIHEFYSDLASEMGISVSAAMVVGLKSYMDAQKGLSMGEEFKSMVEQLTKITNPIVEAEKLK